MVNNNYTIVQKSTDEPLRLEELICKNLFWKSNTWICNEYFQLNFRQKIEIKSQ